MGKLRTAFVATPPESLGHAVQAAIAALIATHYSRAIHIGEVSDFVGELLIPKGPVEVPGKLRGNGAAAAAILSFDGDNPEHEFARPDYTAS
jgi:hypothetical protein